MNESSNDIKEIKKKNKNKTNKGGSKDSNIKWLISVFITTFILSLIFSLLRQHISFFDF